MLREGVALRKEKKELMDTKDKITEEDYKEAIRKVLLAKPKSKYKNCMPTKEELNVKWKLVKS